MANITQLLNNIKRAVLGQDVRDSIHDAIKQCYDDATSADNANMEVAQARGTYSTLKNRLDAADAVDSDTQANIAALEANKADKTALQAVASGSPAGSYPDIASIPAGADTTRIYLITSGNLAGHWVYYNGSAWVDGGVYQAAEITSGSIINDKLSMDSVAPWNCTFFAGDNLYDGTQEIGYISPSGEVTNTTNAQYQHSPYISVTPGKVYTLVYPLHLSASIKQPNVFAYKSKDDIAPAKLDVTNRDANYPIYKLTIPAEYSYIRFNTASPTLGDYSNMVLVEGTYDNADLIRGYDLEYRYNGGMKGKIIVIAGDSITTGWQPDGSTLAMPFPQKISQLLKATVYNKGVGATKIASPSGKKKSSDFCQPERYQTFLYPDSNTATVPDIITIFAGVNDHTLDTPLGDMTCDDETTYYGALKVLIKGLLSLISKDANARNRTKIVFATPLIRYTATHPYGSFGDNNTEYFWNRYSALTDEAVMTKNNIGYRLKDYVIATQEVCALYSIPVLDMFSASNVTKGAMCVDGVHTPQQTSDDILAARFCNFLRTGMQSSHSMMYDSVGSDWIRACAVTPEKTVFLRHVDDASIYEPSMLTTNGIDSSGQIVESQNTQEDKVPCHYKSIAFSISQDTYYKISISNSNFKNQCRIALFNNAPNVGNNGSIVLDSPHKSYADCMQVTFKNSSYTYAVLMFFCDVFSYDDDPYITIFESLSEYFPDTYTLAENIKVRDYNLETDTVQIKRNGDTAEIELFDGNTVPGGLSFTGANSDSDYNLENYSRTNYITVHENSAITIYDPTNPKRSLYGFLYPDIDSSALKLESYEVEPYDVGAIYKFTVPAGYKYFRMTVKGPETGDRAHTLSIKENKTYFGTAFLAKGEEVLELSENDIKMFGRTVIRCKNPRPDDGIVRFSVQVDTSFWTDGATMQTDYGILMLPTNYTPNGDPVRLVIACHGAGTSYTADCDTMPVQPAEYLVKCLGYAVMDVNGYPGGKLHYGSPVALRSYLAAYRYVIDNYNIRTDGCFVYGSSMGGLSSNMIVNSGAVPVLAQGGFAPVLDHFKQCYCLPWNDPAEQRAAIAEQFGFSGSFDFASAVKDITKAEYDYYISNVDKVCGYNPIQFGCTNWLDINPYGKVAFASPAESWQCSTAESQNMYSNLRIYHPVPVKIWHVADDNVVKAWYSQRFVQAVKNAGCLAEYRNFSSGGHIAWNVGADISVKTLEGAAYTVKNSGYELGIWFKRFE